MEYKKISVLIVTYNQADVIGRNIESILQQREYGLHEIVICDDCSPDNNWEVIQSYVEKYPNIIRAYRNNPNLGIYGNSDKCASLHGDADLFCWLEGDDALCDGFFKVIQETIMGQKIDVSRPVAIQTNYKIKYPDGKEMSVYNGYLSKRNCNSVSAKIRGLTTWRASVFSASVINCFKPTLLDRGLALAEGLFDLQWFKYANRFYYANIDGSIYYAEIGVSVNLNGEEKEKWATETVDKWKFLAKNELISRRDILFAKGQMYLAKFRINNSFVTYIAYFIYTLLGSIGYPISLHSALTYLKYVKRF